MFENFLKTKKGKTINGPIILSTEAYEDERGLFFEGWNLKCFNKQISNNINFVQDNFSVSKKGVLRGLHYQKSPYEQAKLVRVISGSIFDVVVDIRKNSKNFSLSICEKPFHVLIQYSLTKISLTGSS